MTQLCHRCQGLIRTEDPRGIIDGKVFHFYCHWKIEEQTKEKAAEQAKGGDKNAPP